MKEKILAVILAGGDSGRFWPLRDKSFFPFFGKPLLFYCLDRLKKAGLEDFLVIYTKNNESQLTEFSQNYPQFNLAKSIQTDPRGMAGAILSVAEQIQDRRILIIGPEEVYQDSLVEDVFKSITQDTQVLLVGYETQKYIPGGYLEVENGLVEGVVEKPKEGREPSNLVNIVFHYYKDPSTLLKYLRGVKGDRDDIYEKTLDQMMKDGYKFRLYTYKGFWGYLKYPWHTLDITGFYLDKIKGQNIAKSAKIDTRATIRGPVVIGENVKILEYAKIVGPTYIGEGTIIGNNVMVRRSMIGRNSVVGFATEIGRSYVGDNCWFHTNYIGDSVIAANVGLGAGAILANFRLDEGSIKSFIRGKMIDTGKIKLGAIVGSNVRIGVNTSIMPGVKVGESSFIGAGIVLDKDLPDNKFCYFSETQYKVKDNKMVVSDALRVKMKNKLTF